MIDPSDTLALYIRPNLVSITMLVYNVDSTVSCFYALAKSCVPALTRRTVHCLTLVLNMANAGALVERISFVTADGFESVAR